jgi:hypothetical protein
LLPYMVLFIQPSGRNISPVICVKDLIRYL